jgi:hypothetical protein
MGNGVIVASDDHGAHWTPHAIPGASSSAEPYLAVISSKNQDTLYVRTDAYADMDGIDTANDSLIVSTDAGATWTTVFNRHAKLFGFALSPDEKTLLAGYGDPQLSATTIEPTDVGLYEADVATLLADVAHGDTHFTKIFSSSVTCLRWTPTALFACTLVGETGFEVGRAADASFTNTTTMPFSPVLLLGKVEPLACGQGTSAFGCYTDPVNGFPFTCAAIGASCDASAPPPGTVSGVFTGGGGSSHADAGVLPSSGGAAAASSRGGAPPGSGGTVSGASGTPSTAAGGTSAGGAAPASPSGGPSASTSCGCRLGADAGSSRGGTACIALLALGVRRVRRKRR